VRQGNLEGLRERIKTPTQANLRNAQGATLLMQAALNADASVVRFLLAQGADPKLTNPLGATALHWAAGDPTKVALLLEAGADPNAKSNLGRTPVLIAAATPGNAASLRLLLGKGGDPKIADQSGDGPLGSAASAGDLEMMRLLIDAGANIQERGNRGPAFRGVSPLMRAALANCAPCVDLLLKHQADPNLVSLEPRVVKAGQQELGNLTALVLAAQNSNAPMVKALLDAGAKFDVADARGFTPLLMAVTHETQDRATVELLLARGANRDARSRDGQSAGNLVAKWGPHSPLARLIPPSPLPPAPPIEKPAALPTAPLAVSRALNLFAASNDKFFERSGCAGCHHQMMSGLLAGVAAERGVALDHPRFAKQLAAIITVNQPSRETSLQRVSIPGHPFVSSLLLVSMAAQSVPASPLTDALVHDIALAQGTDGSWFGTQRPPMQYSKVSETALALRALQLYAAPGRRAEIDARIAKARAWLSSAPAPFTEETVMKHLGLLWAGAHSDPSPILKLQGKDGSWSQRPGLPGDAYATGQALYALAQSKGQKETAAFRRGVQFLLTTQAADGSWYVRSRAVKFQPYFESGFPYGHDQWISAAGTAWAALALTQTLPQATSRASAPMR
jgi:ankyrin repeat protein